MGAAELNGCLGRVLSHEGVRAGAYTRPLFGST